MKFKNFRKRLQEADMLARSDAPAVLVLRRRGIRVYPDGQRVALYHNDRYNMIFTVPIGGMHAAAPITGVVK